MLDTTTKRRIDTARDILVGKVPDPKSQVEQITIALIYKFMDDMDLESEDLGGEPSFFSGDYEKYGWRKIFNPTLGGFEMLSLYSEAIQRMSQNPNLPQLFRDIFKNAYLPYRDPETLKSFLKIIDDFSYDHSEKLGDAFEYLLSVLGSQGDAGQFRTPRHVIDFMTALIAPKKNETILDPACGTAGFLISAYKHIWKENSSNYNKTDPYTFEQNNVKLAEITVNGKHYKGDKISPDERARIIQNIKGYDISPDMVRLSLVNLYLHSFTEPHIHEYDTLTSEERWNEFYDIILANPPFMSPKGGIRPHKRFSVQSKRSEVLFVDYIAEHLTPTGRAAVIVPEGIIFQSGTAYKSLRKMLVEGNYLVGIISLPAGVFNPYSGVKTSILWLDKTLAKKTDKILFAKIENDGFDLGAQRRPIKQNDLPEVFRKLTKYRDKLILSEDIDFENEKLVSLVEKEKIAENGEFNLSGERYKVFNAVNSDYELVKLGEVTKLYQPHTISQNEMKDEGRYLVYGANGIIGKYDQFNHEDREVLITCRGATCGTINMSAPKSWITGNAMVAQPVELSILNKDYLFYVLKNSDLSSTISGAAQPQITRQNLSPFKIPLPPLSVQEEIVAELESYQKIIDGARQVIENYKPKIDIDPDWEMVELGEAFNKVTKSVLPIDMDADEVNYLGLDNISQGTGHLVGNIKANPKEIKSAKTLFKTKYILYGKLRPNLNKVYFAEIEGICSTDFFVLEAKEDVNPKFYSYYFLSQKFKSEVLKGIKGAQLPRVGYEYFTTIIIPKPPLESQDQIVVQIDKERELVNANKQLIEIYEQKIKDRIKKIWGE